MVIVTKHISLDKTCVDKMQSYVDRHEGNFSSAMREVIDRAGRSGLPNSSLALDIPLFDWLLERVDGTLIPNTILDEIIDPRLMSSMKNLEDYINSRFRELEWDIKIDIKCDNNTSPSNAIIEIDGNHYQKVKFMTRLISQYLVKNSLERNPLEIKSSVHTNNSIRTELCTSDKKKAIDSLVKFFGELNGVMSAIKDNPTFWKSIIHRHVISNYNMVTVHRNYFEDILLGKTPMGEIMIENIAKKPVQEIPIKDMLLLIKDVYETSRVADRVEINNDSITLFHSFRDLQAVDKLRKSLVMILDANGHLYDARMTSNMIILKHRPDIGIKINEIVDKLKMSESSVDQELIMFMAFIKGLKEIPDMPLFLTSLGRRIGKSLLREYEKENNIKKWNLEEFKKALDMINSKIRMDCEWKLDGNSLLYRVRKCSMVSQMTDMTVQDDAIDNCVCHTSREVFKGALDYAFGNKAELTVNKLLSHGDDYCEVVIRLV